jgi:hypothetical protein
MNIATQIEILLRGSGYETWRSGADAGMVCFENAAVIGFVHVFPTAQDLLDKWQQAQSASLSQYGPALRSAGAKAWNVYSVFLTEELAVPKHRAVEQIEEDFALTRKIARAGVRTADDVERALLPLIALRSHLVSSDSDFKERLQARLSAVPSPALSAFLSDTPAEVVARILTEAP